MSNIDVLVVQELTTVISRMILLSTPTWKQISNLSPFLVPPRNSKTADNINFLKLVHVMTQEGKGNDEKKVVQITSQAPQWTCEVTGLRKQIKNFAKLCSIVFGDNSVLARSLCS